MERIEKQGNITKYYIDDRLSLAIIDLGNNHYITENSVNRLEGYCKILNDYRTECRLDKNYTIGKNGRFYNSKKLIEHNTKWFVYILQERGFIAKTLPIS